MLELREWIRIAGVDDRPWLILGKGPTFSRRADFDLTQYNLLSLNHVVRELPVDVAHVMDVDVVEDCGEQLPQNCRWLIMPRVPHIQQRPGHARLEDYRDAIPVLRNLDEQGRLVWYNAKTSPAIDDSPVIDVTYFSSEAALSILGELGARVVRSLGVDGGVSYSSAFSSIASKTRLANKQPSFDLQFGEMDRIVRRYGIDYRPLIQPLRVFIGASRRDLLAVRVLDYSIRKNASVPVRIVPMVDLPVPKARHRRNQARTGFSFSRFLVPELAGFSGRAVYLDSDMLVFGDVAELGDYPLEGKKALCTFQPAPPPAWAGNPEFHPGRHSAVMVLDCDQLKWRIEEVVAELDSGRTTYEELMSSLRLSDDEIGALPTEWNHLERFEPGVTKLLHYTVVPTQPWRARGNPLEHVWEAMYREAVEAGAIPVDEVRELAHDGLIRRDLVAALDNAPCSPRSDLTAASVALSAAFNRIDDLESRTVRTKARRAARQVAPLIRKTRAFGPASPFGEIVERAEAVLRRLLAVR